MPYFAGEGFPESTINEAIEAIREIDPVLANLFEGEVDFND